MAAAAVVSVEESRIARKVALSHRVASPIEALERRVLLSAAPAATNLKTGPLKRIGDQLATLYQQYLATQPSAPVSNSAKLSLATSAAVMSTAKTTSVKTTSAPAIASSVQIEAYAKSSGSSLASSLKKMSATHVTTSGRTVTANVPVSDLAKLAALPGLQFAQPAWSVTNVGAVTSQGDFADLASAARATYGGLTGAGIKVGIISDSFNTSSSSDKYANDVTSGDLPSGVTILGDYSGTNPAPTDEGRAMAQMVYDSAPGATLLFDTAQGGQSNFAAAIAALTTAGAKVIVDDVSYLAEPMFEDGVIAQAVDKAVASGVSYFSAVGNNARNAYASTWQTGNVRAKNSISSAAGAPTFYGGTTFNFGTPSAVNDMNSFTLAPGASITLSLQWDSPYYSATGGKKGSTNDVDAYVLNALGTQVVGGSATNNVGGDPTELFRFTNTTSTTTPYNLMITWDSASGGLAPNYLKYVDFSAQATNWGFAENAGAAFGHANSIYDESVAAASYASTPYYTGTSNVPTIESYSSAGGTPIFYDTSGNYLGTAGVIRQTPDITAPDGGDTTFFGFQTNDGDNYPNFYGTSAAAPSAAAVAALLLQANSSLTPAQVDTALQSTATYIPDAAEPGVTTVNFLGGYGFIQANAAVATVVGTLSGTVYRDNNSNGTLDGGESGVGGVTVFVDANKNGVLDSGELSTTTAANGSYTFLNIAAGSETVREVIPAAYVGTTITQTVTLTGGSTLTNINLGLFATTFTGTSGNDSYTLQVDATKTTFLDILVSGVLMYQTPKTAVTSLNFNLGAGDDTLTVNYTNGSPIPSVGIDYDGGANATSTGDSLIVNGSANADSVLITSLYVAPGLGSIAIANIENVTVSLLGGNDSLSLGQLFTTPVTYDGGTGTNTLSLLGTGNGDTDTFTTGQLSINSVVTTYTNVQTLTVTWSNGASTSNVNLGTGAPALVLNEGNDNDTVNLNAGAMGSAVTILGFYGNDVLNIAAGYASPVNFNGGGNTNSVNFAGTAGNDAINVTATTVTSAVTALTYSNIAALTINTGTGNDITTISAAPASSIALVVNGGGGNDSLIVNAALASSGTTTTFNGGVSNTAAQNTLTVNAGTYTLTGNPAVTSANLTVNDNSTVIFAAAAAGTGINARSLAALNIGSGDTATVTASTAFSDRAVLVLGALSVASTSTLNLGNNDAIVKGGNVGTIGSAILSGYHAGLWNGTGIDSSSAAADSTRAIGYGVVSDFGSLYSNGFDGQAVGTSDVLIAFTIKGDADLSRTVDSNDLTLFNAGFGTTGSAVRWSQGDFNYDLSVDVADLDALSNYYGSTVS